MALQVANQAQHTRSAPRLRLRFTLRGAGYSPNAATCAAQADSDARHRARRLQAAEACEGTGLQSMVAACCAADGE